MNCPYCNKYFAKKQDTVNHIDSYHQINLQEQNMNAEQALYFSTHGTLHGKCICGCDTPTEWNYKTGKPYKVSPDPECRVRLNKIAEKNMITARGYDKKTLMNDINHQKELLNHRHTTGEYKFSDGNNVTYNSSLELNFLKFCDIIMEFSSNMIQESPESFEYFDNVTNTKRKYIPDYYLPDYNLLVEIKDGGKTTNTNPAFVKETKYKVAMKDNVMKNQTKYNYIRISGANYGPFLESLYKIVHDKTPDKTKHKNLIVITESALFDIEESIDFMSENYDNIKNAYFIIIKDINTGNIKGYGLTDRSDYGRWFISDIENTTVSDISYSNNIFSNSDLYIYKYAGNIENIIPVFEFIHTLTLNQDKTNIWDILKILKNNAHILFNDGDRCFNNTSKMSDFILLQFIHNKSTH